MGVSTKKDSKLFMKIANSTDFFMCCSSRGISRNFLKNVFLGHYHQYFQNFPDQKKQHINKKKSDKKPPQIF